MLGIRRSFYFQLTKEAEKNNNIVIICADMFKGNNLEKFQQSHPEQIYNVGIAEQNMIGIAAGMAKVGLNVFAVAFSTFISTRCFDQVRVNLGYMNLPIKLVGRGSGLGNNVAGPTHYAVEDIALLRTIPNMTVVVPADALEAVKIAEAAVNSKNPMYIRLVDAANVPIVYKDDYDFQILLCKQPNRSF